MEIAKKKMSMTIEAEQEKHRKKIRSGQRVRKKCGVELQQPREENQEGISQ